MSKNNKHMHHFIIEKQEKMYINLIFPRSNSACKSACNILPDGLVHASPVLGSSIFEIRGTVRSLI